MESFSMVKEIAANFCTWLFATCALAQPLTIASDPSALARAAIGSEPGSASVAIWRAGPQALDALASRCCQVARSTLLLLFDEHAAAGQDSRITVGAMADA